MSVTATEMIETFPDLLSQISGPLENFAVAPCAAENPQKGGLAYLNSMKHLNTCLKAELAILIVDNKLRDQLRPVDQNICLLSSSSLQEAMARVNQKFFPVEIYKQPFDGQRIHPSAVISNSARVSESALVGPNAVIGEAVTIGDNCIVGANAVIEAHSQIGDGSHIFALVYIGHHTQLGRACIVQSNTSIASNGYGYGSSKEHKHFYKPHYGNVVLQDRVEIGANVSLDRGIYAASTVGEGTKIDNHCHLGHNFTCGKNCLITAGFISAGSVVIGDNCTFGGRNSVNNKITITDNCMFSALTAQTGHVTEPGIYGGYPVQKYKDNLRSVATLPHLPKLKKDVETIKKKLGLE